MKDIAASEVREVSLDVDRLMDRIDELSRLTRESIQEDVDSPLLAAGDGGTGSPSCSFAQKGSAVARHIPSVDPSLSSSRRSSKGSKTSAGYAESALVIARLENVIEQVRRRAKERRGNDRRESVSLGSQSESPEESSKDVTPVDDILEDFRHRIAKLETETRMLCELFMESENRIKSDVLAKLDKVIEAKLQRQYHSLESQSCALENKCHVLEHLCENLESQAQQRLGALQALYASITREAVQGKQRAPAPSEAPTNDILSSASNSVKLSQLDDLKSQVLADVEGKMAILRQEVSGIERNIRLCVCEHFQAEVQERINGHQKLMEEIENETKARLSDSLDVWRTLSASHSEPPSRAPVEKFKIAQRPIMAPIR